MDPKIAVFRWPIASRSIITEHSQFRSNWPPENSDFTVLKNRQPKSTCLKAILRDGQNKVWGKILSNTLLTFPEGDSKFFPQTLFCPPLKMAFRQVPLGCLSLWALKLLFSGGQLLQN